MYVRIFICQHEEITHQ